MIKTKRFFFHFNKPASQKAGTPKMTVHYGKTCFIVDKIICNVPTESKINKTQPRIVIQGFANFFMHTKNTNGLSEVLITSCEKCAESNIIHLCSFK
jgi:hypothetical protein